jgi:hypothetical protein
MVEIGSEWCVPGCALYVFRVVAVVDGLYAVCRVIDNRTGSVEYWRGGAFRALERLA